MGTMRILDPTYEVKEAAEAALPSLDGLGGKTIAFLSNGWPSLNTVFDILDRSLRAEYGVAATFIRDIPLSDPAPDELLDEVVNGCDAAVVALGN
ncbi:hypothetical protein ACFLTS_03205 [Chloroflexota bacterium]